VTGRNALAYFEPKRFIIFAAGNIILPFGKNEEKLFNTLIAILISITFKNKKKNKYVHIYNQGILKGGSITVPLTSCLTGLD
jgi:hypothetical protein